MEFQIKVYQRVTVEIPDDKLEDLKKGLCERWGEEYDPERIWDDYDLLVQAEHDGLIELPEKSDWEID